jgi:hypothetical protein
MLPPEGLITLKQIYTDGTKTEAQAGRYTCIWGTKYQNKQINAKTVRRIMEVYTKHRQ